MGRAFNRVASLAAAHSIPAGEYEAKQLRGEVSCGKGAYTSAARESYKDGLARGLLDAVRQSKQQKELEQVRLVVQRAVRLSCGQLTRCCLNVSELTRPATTTPNQRFLINDS